MRKLMCFAIGFGLACILGAYFYSYVNMWIAVVAAIIFLISVILSYKLEILKIPAVIAVAFVVGICWFLMYDNFYLSNGRVLDDKTINISAEASDFGYDTGYGTGVSGWISLNGKPYQVMIYLDGAVEIDPGDLIDGSFSVRFTSEGGSREPTYHRSDGIFLLLYQRGEAKIQEASDTPLKYYPVLWRERILETIDQIFTPETVDFAKALLIGERMGIDYETYTAFKISGISHIVAVSGLHVSILFSLVYLFSGRKRLLLFLIGTPVLLLFAAITGFTPSITRACIMQFLVLLALLFDREYDPPTALAFAALVMLTVNPMVVLSISFQLSIGCMIGIFLFCRKIHDWLLDEKRLGSAKGKGIIPRLKRWLVSSVSVSLSASIVTTPLVAYYFGTISLVGLLTNLLVVWVVSYIFYGIMISCAVSLISITIGQWTAWLVSVPIHYVIGTAKLLAQFPLAAVYTQSIYIVIWLIVVYLLLVCYLCLKKKPAVIYGCCAGICLCAALLASWTEPLLDECRVTALDVGQGQAILLQSEGKTFLIDCGGDRATEAADTVAQTALSQGISHLDGIILTHYDEDHAGGVPYLLTRLDADAIFLPDIANETDIGSEIQNKTAGHTILVSEDIVLHYGSTTITIFAPELFNFGNESGLCVLFQTENCDILITGDRGELGEMLLLHRTELPDLELLIAGHHGSRYSTGEELLRATTPEYVFISAGRNNRYGHPSPVLLQRLAEYGSVVYRTDLNGTIIFRR